MGPTPSVPHPTHDVKITVNTSCVWASTYLGLDLLTSCWLRLVSTPLLTTPGCPPWSVVCLLPCPVVVGAVAQLLCMLTDLLLVPPPRVCWLCLHDCLLSWSLE